MARRSSGWGEQVKISKKSARVLVDAVLGTLHERRPFKHDLEKMMFQGATEWDLENGREGPLWREMMRTMRDDLIEAAASLPAGKKRAK